MDTEIDWQRELDRSFGSGDDVAPAHYVVTGRGAVRRRRAVTAIVLAASVAVAGTALWAVSPGSSPRGEAPVATQGPAPVDDTAGGSDAQQDRLRSLAELSEQADARIDFLGEPAALADGGLVLAPGTGRVLERVPNPMGYTPAQGTSLAIRVMVEGREKYSLMAAFPDGTSTTSNDASGDFEGWLAAAVASQRTLDDANGVTQQSGQQSGQQGAPAPEDWLVLGPDGTVRAATDRVEVLAVRDGVDLGDGFAADADRTGVVRLRVDGDPVSAAYRLTAGVLEVIPGGGRFDSLDAFVTWAREQYASGEGLR